jgi:hypothetical protein
MKVGSRDLAVARATCATGGTTVSATCELAAAAGIAEMTSREPAVQSLQEYHLDAQLRFGV